MFTSSGHEAEDNVVCWHGASPRAGERLHKRTGRPHLHAGVSLVISHLNVKASRRCLHNKTFLSAEPALVLNFMPQLSCTPRHFLIIDFLPFVRAPFGF